MKAIPLLLLITLGMISCQVQTEGVGTSNSANRSTATPVASTTAEKPSTGESVTFKGRLHSNEKESTILYYGEESGDLAGFCFDNDSDAGRRILAACKAGEICEFSGEVDYSATDCPFDEGRFSAEGRITKLTSARAVAGSLDNK